MSTPQNLNTIWLSVTNKCNLACAHCKLGRPEKEKLKFAKRIDMSDGIFEKIKNEVLPFVRNVTFGGSELSEQLFCKRWDYFFDEVARFPVDITVITNGVLLNEYRVKKLIDRGAVISFSVESVKRELYEKIRGRFYDKVFGMIKYACDLMNKSKENKAAVTLGFTIFRDNVYELPELVSFANRQGIKQMYVAHLCPQFEYQREQSLAYHKDLYNEIYDITAEKARNANVHIDLPPKFYVPRINEEGYERRIKSEGLCHFPFHAAAIGEDGKVSPCCGSSSIMGDLRKNDFIDIWNGPKYKRLRKTINTELAPGYCRDCILRTRNHAANSKLLSAIGADKGFSLKKMFLLNLRGKMLENKIAKSAYYALEKIYKKIF